MGYQKLSNLRMPRSITGLLAPSDQSGLPARFAGRSFDTGDFIYNVISSLSTTYNGMDESNSDCGNFLGMVALRVGKCDRKSNKGSSFWSSIHHRI